MNSAETAPEAVIHVTTATVACDGGALGHPRVYLNLGPEGEIDCPYCGRHYVLDAGARPASGH
jgi:uncharacterized Zn-finger protein